MRYTPAGFEGTMHDSNNNAPSGQCIQSINHSIKSNQLIHGVSVLFYGISNVFVCVSHSGVYAKGWEGDQDDWTGPGSLWEVK